LINALIVIVY
jgi:hypothetical protein